MFRRFSFPLRASLLTFILLSVCAAVFCCVAPIAQSLNYHDFADKRRFWNIPNYGDVVSNIFFVAGGLVGLLYLKRKESAQFYRSEEIWLWMAFFLGMVGVGLGSAYYHLAPTNLSLVWDRLPMAIVFMSFFSLIVAERVHWGTGFLLAPILIAIGIYSVWHWHATELEGAGDLRLYALVQFLPLLGIPLIMLLFPARYDNSRWIAAAGVWIIAAKLAEHFDRAIFEALGHVISGHTLKHIFAASGVYCLAGYVRDRKKAGA